MRSARLVPVAAGAAASLLILAGPASAHVTVHGPEATQGGFAKLTFQVPTEKDIPTTRLEIDLPAAQPLAFVSVKQHAGWTIDVTKTKLAKPIKAEAETITTVVSKIVWTAQPGQGIKPGYFDEFEVSAGFLPKADQMVFKALQTYSDGSVVRWIEPVGADGAEPQQPAPVLHLVAATTTADHAGMASASPAASASPMVSATAVPAAVPAASEKDSTARSLSGIALALSVVALVLGGAGVFAARRTRRR